MPDTNLQLIELGAMMYVPALSSALVEVGNGWKYSRLRSVIYCTEDAVSERDLPLALDILAKALVRLEPAPLRRFVRPRNPELLRVLLDMKGIDNIDGFVIPKADLSNLPLYFSLLERHEQFAIMIIVETAVAFDVPALCRLRDFLFAHPLKNRITAIRIGALDLLSLLGLRRESGQTIYDTPLLHVIDQMITVFRPAGFHLAASGFDCFNAHDILSRELALDLTRGLLGKTALHPEQIDIINAAYRVSRMDLDMARAIHDPERPAVFRYKDRMCEKTVHTNWAVGIEARASIYGVRENTNSRTPDLKMDRSGLA